MPVLNGLNLKGGCMPTKVINPQGPVKIGSFTLHYRIEGTGTPTIVLGSATYYPRIFSQNLRKHLQLIFMDIKAWAPPCGIVNTSEFELDVILDDIEHIRKTLGVGPVIIIGHSGHAFIALEYAKKYPDNVSHVVMIGTGPDFSEANTAAAEQYWQDSGDAERKAALTKSLQRITDEQLTLLPPDQRWIKNYIRLSPKIWYDYHFDALPLWKDVDINMQVFNYIWGEVFKTIDITQGLPTFDKPVFLGLGRHDYIMPPPSSWDAIRSKFQNLYISIFEQSGHTPQFEEPELFDKELLNWLSAQK